MRNVSMSEQKLRNQNLTVPNLLSVIRILIVPFFAYYFLKDNIVASVILLVISGLSDAVDGLIARKFNQITELGKMLDPFADKITQATVAICLAIKYPAICPLLILFIVKEFAMLVLAVLLLKKQRKPCAAKWYGKVSTVLFYLSVIVIVTMSIFQVDQAVFKLTANILLAITAVMMIYAGIKYFAVFRNLLRSEDPVDWINLPEEIKTKK